MGTTTVYDMQFHKLAIDQPSSLLDRVKRMEKHIFPKDEAMDFDMELHKRNTEMAVILGAVEPGQPQSESGVAAYMVYARLHGIALLHKICVADGYQHRGIGTGLLSMLKDKLQAQGCERLQLWVDVARRPARRLYESVGFSEADWSRDYYGPGRTGVKMVLELNTVW